MAERHTRQLKELDFIGSNPIKGTKYKYARVAQLERGVGFKNRMLGVRLPSRVPKFRWKMAGHWSVGAVC